MKKKGKKRIVLAVNSSWNIFNFRLNLIKEIKRQGHEVILVAPYDKYSDRLKKEFEYYDIWINNKGLNPIEDIRTFIEFYKLYKKIKPDIVLHFTVKPNIYGTLACRLLGIKTINNIAGLGTLFVKHNFITKVAKILYKHSQKKVNTIFFQNRDDYEMFISENLVEASKCNILPGSGVDTKKFKPVDYKKTDNIFRFLLISRMLWDKGIGEYVEAARKIKQQYSNVEFLLLGFVDVKNRTAISKEQIQRWVEEDIVSYLGVSDNVKEEISKVDCIVLPSFYREGTPRVLLESASMEKPIITTNNVGCKDVVDDGINGYICEIKNSNDLAIKMKKIVDMPLEDLTKMGKLGRKKVLTQFDEKIVIEKYLKAINSITKNY